MTRRMSADPRWRNINPGIGRWIDPSALDLPSLPHDLADPNPMPTFVLLPVLERARIRTQEARGRLRDAWSVLCGRESIYEDRSEW